MSGHQWGSPGPCPEPDWRKHSGEVLLKGQTTSVWEWYKDLVRTWMVWWPWHGIHPGIIGWELEILTEKIITGIAFADWRHDGRGQGDLLSDGANRILCGRHAVLRPPVTLQGAGVHLHTECFEWKPLRVKQRTLTKQTSYLVSIYTLEMPSYCSYWHKI